MFQNIVSTLISVLLLTQVTYSQSSDDNVIEVRGSIGSINVRLVNEEYLLVWPTRGLSIPARSTQDFSHLHELTYRFSDADKFCHGPSWYIDVCEPLLSNDKYSIQYISIGNSRSISRLNDANLKFLTHNSRGLCLSMGTNTKSLCDFVGLVGELDYRISFVMYDDTESDVSDLLNAAYQFTLSHLI